ncbi:MAG TPA: DAK2 domain-containing protein, partial [Longimicrobiales bacterium]|nr:DAK2 domain-containing protein [Longimicrobiales bacterium]
MDAPLRIAYVDGPRLRRSLVAACDHAQRQRGELNRINVFPVPDGDTGTNLALTVRAISDHLRDNRDSGVAAVAREAAQAAVLGARGNCGMMLSHFLLGFADALGERARIRSVDLSEALRAGVSSLYAAIERPVEGTILTVMRETADAAEESEARDLVTFFDQLLSRARSALARTPDLLPVLRKAGVVDAGAKGFVSLLEGVVLFIHGDPLVSVGGRDGEVGAVESSSAWRRRSGEGRDSAESVEASAVGPDTRAAAAALGFDESRERYRFCTEALVRGSGLPTREVVVERLRGRGDSLIVIRS